MITFFAQPVGTIFCIRFFALMLLSCFLQTNLASCQSNIEFVEQLNQHINPFKIDFTNSISSSNTELEKVLADRKIIALGEATHGTKEFFHAKYQVIKDLVIKGDVKCVAMETDYFGLLPLNRYLLDDRPLDSLANLFKSEVNIYVIYYTQEVLDLFKWIKEYNLKQPIDNRVQVWGIDMQNSTACLNNLLVGVPAIKDNPSFMTTISEIRDKVRNNKFKKLSKETVEKYLIVIDSLADFIKKSMQPQDTLMALHNVQLLRQNILLQKTPGFLEKEWMNLTRERDKYMAENVIWLNSNLCKANEKVVVWAHNGHVAHAQLEDSYRMGWYLQQQFKEQFYTICLLFNEGYVRLFDAEKTRMYQPFYYPPAAKSSAIEQILSKCKDSVYFLNLLNFANNDLTKRYFSKYNLQRELGARHLLDPNKDYSTRNLLECFDGLIFYNKTSAAESIK